MATARKEVHRIVSEPMKRMPRTELAESLGHDLLELPRTKHRYTTSLRERRTLPLTGLQNRSMTIGLGLSRIHCVHSL